MLIALFGQRFGLCADVFPKPAFRKIETERDFGLADM
jgi:hypothetical protein